MQILEILSNIAGYITAALGVMYCYRVVFYVLGFFKTRQFRPAQKQHRYAVLVAARNEEPVIGNLIRSIRANDYPSELVSIFVVADNCTDGTAEAAEAAGAICYRRFDSEHRTKGFALQYLVERIREDYGIESFDGYFIFDADNLLKKDYISRMNEAFDEGEKIITSYRNTKNFNDNWIAASYGLHWMRTIRTEHRARSVLRLATRIQGTGFLFASELIKNGWNYTSLTEDRAFTADAVVAGYRISYNDAAEFYDEQPTDLRIAIRQRIRWAKGHIQAFVESGGKLAVQSVKNIFTVKGFVCYDVLMTIIPKSVITVFASLLALVTALISAAAGDGKLVASLLVLWTTFYSQWTDVAVGAAVAAYVFFTERKRMRRLKWYKYVWYSLTFFLFDLIGRYSTIIALFMKVEWKPIPHKVALDIDDVTHGK